MKKKINAQYYDILVCEYKYLAYGWKYLNIYKKNIAIAR